MTHLRALGALLLLATLAACGDSSNAFPFGSRALAEPRGEPVRIAYRMSPGDVRDAGSSGHLDLGMRIQGTQYASLETGLPVGTASVTMEMRADIESGDKQLQMAMDGTITIEAEPL